MADADRIKIKVQRTVVTISVLLLLGKFAAFFITNSVGVLTDAMESIVNVMAGFISLYSIHFAAKPKDDDHPFGHGKVELISASIEGLLIIGAGVLIISEGVKRFFVPAEIEKLDVGIWIVAVAGLINWIMGWYSIRVGHRYKSMALIAGGKHLQSDTYSTIGLVAGLLLLYLTGIGWIDSVLAIIFGGIIAITGVSILKKTTDNLMDKADSNLLDLMRGVIVDNRKDNWIDVHNFKVIKYGSIYFVDCDLTLPWYYNIAQGHASCEELRKALLKGCSEQMLVSIHSDPCNENLCEHCLVEDCPYRKTPFVSRPALTLEELTMSDEKRKEI